MTPPPFVTSLETASVSEDELDEALRLTFPASDPVALATASQEPLRRAAPKRPPDSQRRPQPQEPSR
jgi:hypothetical protein